MSAQRADRRLPPHNAEAEQAVIGTLLMFGAHVETAGALGLTAGSFYAPTLQTIAEAIFECADACDVITVSEHLRRHDQLDRVGGTDALHQLALGTTWSVGMLPGHVRIVVDNARRRQIIHDLADANTAAYNGEPVDTIFAKVTSAADRLWATIPSGFTTLDQIESRPIHWAWENRVPIGELTLVAGAEKIGKSLLCVEIAALASRAQLPGDWFDQPIDVLYLTQEDRIAQVVKPRMQLAEANLYRIHVEPDGGDTPVTIARIADAIRRGVRLVILDPIVLFLDLDDENVDLKVRTALAPIIRLAQQQGAAIIGIKHVNKSEGRAVMNRIAGSRGYTAAVRSVLFVADDPDCDDEANPDRLLFARGNLAPASTGVRYGIIAEPVDLDAGGAQLHPRIEWRGESHCSIEEAFARSDHGKPKDDSHEVDDLIRELLADGPADAADVIETVVEVIGVTDRTVRNHFKDLRGQRRKLGSPTSDEKQKWVWWLPEGETKTPKGSLSEDYPFDEFVSPSTDRDPLVASVNGLGEALHTTARLVDEFPGATVVDPADRDTPPTETRPL